MGEETQLSVGRLIEENRRLSALVELGGTLADSRLDLKAKLQACVETLARLAGAERASLMMVEGDELVVLASTNPDIVGLKSLLRSHTISTNVVDSGEPVYITDVSKSEYADARREGDQSTYRTNSLICLPLSDAGTVAGVLNLSDKLGADAFGEHDFQLAQTIAKQVSGLIYFSALHSRLVEAFNQLDRATRAKDDLMHMILHDLKAPLTGAKEMIRLLRAEPCEEDQRRHHLDLAGSELEQLWRRVSNLLDLSRMDSGAAEMDREPIKLSALAEEARRSLEPVIAVSGVRVWMEAAGDPKAMLDEELAERVVANLLLAALHASAPDAGGRGEVTINISGQDDLACLEVVDTGGGLDPAAASTLFQRPARDASGSEVGSHAMYFCRRAARAMGGDLTFGNLPQGGSRFRFTAPAAEGG